MTRHLAQCTLEGNARFDRIFDNSLLPRLYHGQVCQIRSWVGTGYSCRSWGRILRFTEAFESLHQARFKSFHRCKAQRLSCAGGIAQGVPYLTPAWFSRYELRPTSAQLGDHLGKIADRCRPARADVEHRRLGGNAIHRENKRADHVADIDEIASLATIAQDIDVLPARDPIAEDRDDTGIGRPRILAWPVDIEEPQPGGRHAVDGAGHSRMLLASEFV